MKTKTALLLNLVFVAFVIVGAFLLLPHPLNSDDYSPKATLALDARVDINTADADLLCTLPGIGEKRAEQIVHYRDEHGNYDSLLSLYDAGIPYSVIDNLYSLAYCA